MWVRIAAHYPVWYEVEPLALYRRGSTSLTGNSVRTGKNIQDFRKAVGMVREYLPREYANELSQTALKNYAFYALNSARELTLSGDTYAAMNQIREALRCCYSLKIIRSSVKLMTRMLFQKMISNLHQTARST